MKTERRKPTIIHSFTHSLNQSININQSTNKSIDQTCIWITKCLDLYLCIRSPWLSEWKTFTHLQPSPTTIPHPLNEYPAKVDVQIRVTEDSQQHIFSGFGSCQRDGGDSNPYGGIVYIYNDREVKLYTPVDSGTQSTNTDGGFAFTGGNSFYGPFEGSYPIADVRVRVWRMCDFPAADFTSANEHNVSVSGTSYIDIPHNIGYYPDYVIVQLKMPDNFISEAQGTVFKKRVLNHGGKVCGVIMAYDGSKIRLWPSKKGKFYDDLYGVFCVSDGWGTPEVKHTSASVYVQAWKFSPSDILFSRTDTRGSGISVSPTIPLPGPFDIDSHIFLVQSQAIDGNYTNYVFEAAGSAISDGSAFFEEIGAVVYAYNENEVNLWYPRSGKYLIYVGGTWGHGAPTQASKTASVTVKVIKATSTSPGSPIPHPNKIENAHSFIMGNTSVYTCMSGYASNGGESVIFYDGTQWETTDFNCTVPDPCPYTSSPMIYNLTTLQEKVIEMKKNLRVDFRNTSAYRRSLTCALDQRPSSAYVGYLGITILSLMGGLLLCVDLSNLLLKNRG
ncbi:uncharacterized protein LOC111112473 [Crassostrea virginica]